MLKDICRPIIVLAKLNRILPILIVTSWASCHFMTVEQYFQVCHENLHLSSHISIVFDIQTIYLQYSIYSFSECRKKTATVKPEHFRLANAAYHTILNANRSIWHFYPNQSVESHT